MSFTTAAVAAPNAQSPSSPTVDSRSRAIAALMGSSGNQSQTTPVQNPTQITGEEIIKNTGHVDTDAEAGASTPAVTEPNPEDTSTTSPPPLSQQYAILARKEKALRAKAVQQEQSIKAREAALAAREAEITSKSTQDLSNYISKDQLKANSFNILSELGVTYDQLTQEAIQAQSPEAQYLQRMRAELQEELRQVREEQAKTRQSIETNQTQAYQQALTQIRNEVRQIVNSDPAYETIKATGSVKDVVQLIEKTFNEEGVLLSTEQACEEVENYLVEEAVKLGRLGKVQARLTPQQVKSQVAAASSKSQTQSTMTTLKNTDATTRPLTARERALLAFKNELTKQ